VPRNIDNPSFDVVRSDIDLLGRRESSNRRHFFSLELGNAPRDALKPLLCRDKISLEGLSQFFIGRLLGVLSNVPTFGSEPKAHDA
jgi:hypothetical protein